MRLRLTPRSLSCTAATGAKRSRRWAQRSSAFVVAAEPFDAIIGIGGGGGTSIITRGMRVAADRVAETDGLDARLRRRRPLRRCLRHYDDAFDHRPRRAQQRQPRRPSQRGVRHRRHGRCGCRARGRQALDRLDDVRGHDALRDANRREPARSVRLSRLSRDRNGRPSDGETGRQRPARRRHRCDDH